MYTRDEGAFLIWLGLAVFGTYRLAVLLSQEDGPLYVFAKLRVFTDKRRWDKQNKNPQYAGLWASLDDGLRCSWCCGVWAAGLCALLVCWPTLPGDIILTWLGLAGGQLFLERNHE